MIKGRENINFYVDEEERKKFFTDFKIFSSTLVSDVQNRAQAIGSPLILQNPDIISEDLSVVGMAFVVKVVEGDNIMIHRVLELVEEGDFLIVDGGGANYRALMGELQLKVLAEKKVAGVLVNGVLRDSYYIKNKCPFPVYSLGFHPAGPFKNWGGWIGFPISIQGVIINQGDIVVADGDGISIIPFSEKERVKQELVKRKELEKEWLKKLKRGEKFLDILGLREKLNELLEKDN